jgi:predicted ATP-grasp superfamily ATP-dependent carboligase
MLLARKTLRSRLPPVLLLGGLNILRTLGMARIPAILASPRPDDVAAASRHCGGFLVLPPLERRDAVLEALLAAGERLAGLFGAPLPLFYSNDDYQEIVQAQRERLGRHFRLLLNDEHVARELLDKERFNAFAAAYGLPVPQHLEWDALEDHEGMVLVKPKTRLAWDDSPVYRRLFGGEGKARVFSSARALLADPVAAQLRDQLALQEYVAGDDRALCSYHGVADERGRVLAWFIGRKLRTSPPRTGFSSFIELAHDGALAGIGRAVAERIPLKGVFKLDFKRDAATGRWRLLEINARYNLWHYPAACNGLNLPKVAYDYLVHGTRLEQSPPYRTTFRWLCWRLDLRAFRSLRARGEIGLLAWLWSLAQAPYVCELFAWSDPLPWLKTMARKLRRVPRLTARLTSRFWRWRSTAS